MRKAWPRVALLFAASAMLLLVALPSRRPPSKSIDFSLRLSASTNAPRQDCAVVVSNTLDSLVICFFADGFKEPTVQTAYLSNGIWYPFPTRRSGGGGGVIRPHQALKTAVEVPPGAAAVKVGLSLRPFHGGGSWAGAYLLIADLAFSRQSALSS